MMLGEACSESDIKSRCSHGHSADLTSAIIVGKSRHNRNRNELVKVVIPCPPPGCNLYHACIVREVPTAKWPRKLKHVHSVNGGHAVYC